MAKKDKAPATPEPGNGGMSRGMLAGIIIVVAVIAVAGALYATGVLGGPAAVPADDCGKKVVNYLNTYFLTNASNSTIKLVSATGKGGVYEIRAVYNTQEMMFYATTDCTHLFQGIVNISASPAPAATQTPGTPVTTQAPVKSARPAVELFVMSFCPYGVQAEAAIQPVVSLLGSKANISVHYIANVRGTTIDSVSSLHGTPEAQEDIRQLCIAKYYPQKLWPYLNDFDNSCYKVVQNATQLAACQKVLTDSLGLSGIDACATGSEGISLLKNDVVIADGYKVAGSPTLYINGQLYVGQRSAEAYKQAICARFETQPAECSTDLSTQTAVTASGSCG